MATAASYKKIALYGVAVAILIGANIWRWSAPTSNAEIPAPGAVRLPVADLPELSVAQEFAGFGAPAPRDLFRRSFQDTVAPVKQEPAPDVPPAPDPKAIALANAQSILDAIAVLGILGSDSGPVALVEYDGNVTSVTQGQEILPGYVVKSLSLTHLEVRNEQIGLEKLYLINESGNN